MIFGIIFGQEEKKRDFRYGKLPRRQIDGKNYAADLRRGGYAVKCGIMSNMSFSSLRWNHT